MKEIEKHTDLSNSIWVYSMWLGYLKRNKPLQRLKKWTEDKGIGFRFVHTGGHAMLSDLKKMAEAISPKYLIPIHSFHAEQFERHFKNVRQINDNMVFEV